MDFADIVFITISEPLSTHGRRAISTIAETPTSRYAEKTALEQATGVEPAYSAWEADVLTVIRCLHKREYISINHA